MKEIEEEEDDDEDDSPEFKLGLECEAEHELDEETTKGLIEDHLEEDPKYYTHLKEMEKKYKAKKGRILG